MTQRRDVLVVEVDEGTDQLLARLAGQGLAVQRAGQELLVPLAGDDTFEQILIAVAALDLPLHRLDQRRHGLSELFTDSLTEVSHGVG
jgi:ABC-2 type transport system ATP-binding protein